MLPRMVAISSSAEDVVADPKKAQVMQFTCRSAPAGPHFAARGATVR